MHRALPASTWRLGYRPALAVLLAVVFVWQLPKWVGTATYVLHGGFALDWAVLTESGQRIAAGLNPYATNIDGTLFRWSPLAAWIMVMLGHVPPDVWRIAQFLMLPLIGSVWLVAAVLLTFPFWDSLAAGTITLPIVILGMYALRSESKWPALAYVGACCLVPRPWMLVLAAWLLWKRPELRPPSLAIMAANVVAVALTGWGIEWARMLLASGSEVTNIYNYGPTAVFGTAWLIVGLPLGALLFWKGRVGLAALAASPYLFPHYYLALLWESVNDTHQPRRDPESLTR